LRIEPKQLIVRYPLLKPKMMRKIKTYVIDLFCGAGGTSTAVFESGTNMEVIWCINHDATAIRSHTANYPNCVHATEDIRTFDLTELASKVAELRKDDPTCKIAIWASLECTNFSKAKCGPKEADSRTLAIDMYRYIVLIQPDFFWVENVEEFRDWGPLDIFGNPIKAQKGDDYKEWKGNLCNHFSDVHFDRTLISADYGGVTIRKRLFLQFSLDPAMIGSPIQTHSKIKGNLKPWRAVKEVLELNNIGNSIFTRKKPFVPATHRRILKGLKRYGPKKGTNFGIKYYGQDGHQDVKEPSATLTTKDRISLVHVCIKQDFGTDTVKSLSSPMNTLTTRPKGDLVSVFMHNPQYGGSNRSAYKPAATLIARQDKAPMGVTLCVPGDFNLTHDDEDDMFMKLIKDYCIEHSISDVLVRPLTIREMLKIQGFPDWYKLTGTQTEQKKHIGNSVEVKVGVALFEAIDNTIQKHTA